MAKPTHLEPSKLGTKEYWDALYTKEIANHAHDPSDTGTAWFDDSDAEAKLLAFLEDPERSPVLLLLPGVAAVPSDATSFLDLGTGNGALLFALRDAGWGGPMLGVDYSAQSVEFARRIERARRRGGEDEEGELPDVHFAEHDILHAPASTLLDAKFSPVVVDGWDVVLDKGTFDAISLSAETLGTSSSSSSSSDNHNSNSNSTPRRISEAYGIRVLPLVRPGGLFLITSCNWTEDELRGWFEDGAVQEEETTTTTTTTSWGFEVVGRVEYRSFSFGGVKGQTISSLCFRKVERR